MKNQTMNFKHLNPQASDGADNDTQEKKEITLVDSGRQDDIQRPVSHSREHFVAISDEAKENPILAVRLLQETKSGSKEIKAKLRASDPALSKYTNSFMEARDPTWEFQDDQEKNATAFIWSTMNADKNGYIASREQALKALAKMVEPMTEKEYQESQAKLMTEYNAMNPDSPDNQEARRQAEEDYQREVAAAAARRNERIRATGKAVDGDRRRVGGDIVSPQNEAGTILAGMRAGN
ncbi:hypothetical protein OD632_000802 [Salmonella enterica]|nr:hypothetical protein [Salmonella enterica]